MFKGGAPIRRYGAGVTSYEAPTPTPPPIGCAYAENGDASSVGALPLVLSNNDQTGSYTYQGGLVSPETYAMVPPDGLGTSQYFELDASSQVNWEWDVVAPSMVDGGAYADAGVVHTTYAYKSDFGAFILAKLESRLNGEYQFNLSVTGVDVLTLDNLATAPAVITMGADGVGGALSIKLDGAAQVLSDDTFLPGSYIIFGTIAEQAGIAAGNATHVGSLTLVTNADDIQYGDSGYTDPCGNPV